MTPAPQPMIRVLPKREFVGAMRMPPATQFTISVSRMTMSIALTPSQSTPQVPAVMTRSPSMTFAYEYSSLAAVALEGLSVSSCDQTCRPVLRSRAKRRLELVTKTVDELTEAGRAWVVIRPRWAVQSCRPVSAS